LYASLRSYFPFFPPLYFTQSHQHTHTHTHTVVVVVSLFGLSKAALDSFVAFGLLFFFFCSISFFIFVDMLPVFVIYAASLDLLRSPKTTTTKTITFYALLGATISQPQFSSLLTHFMVLVVSYIVFAF